MVLSRNTTDSNLKSTRVLGRVDEIQMFLIDLANIEMRGKNDLEKCSEFMELLEGLASEFFIERFTKDATLTTEGMDFSAAKGAFVDIFAIIEAPKATIEFAMEENLDGNNLKKFLTHIDALYSRLDSITRQGSCFCRILR